MDTENVQLVQTSFERILPAMEQVAIMFYRRLCELEPVLQPAADTDLQQHGGILRALLVAVVKGLPRLEQVLPVLQQAGGTVSKTAIEAHYLPVGAALVWALEQTLCEHFTFAVRLAWLETYTRVVALLQDAAPDIAESGI